MPISFQVLTARNGRALAAFTPAVLNPESLRAFVARASERVPGSRVGGAELTAMTVQSDAEGRYVFGTAAVLRFDEPQSAEQLHAARLAVAEVLAEAGYECVATTGSDSVDLLGLPA